MAVGRSKLRVRMRSRALLLSLTVIICISTMSRLASVPERHLRSTFRLDKALDDSFQGKLSCSQEIQAHNGQAWCCAWNPNGTLLATSGSDKQVSIWERIKEKCGAKDSPLNLTQDRWNRSHVLDGIHSRTIRSVKWSPCGNFLATASFDGRVGIWKLEDRKYECFALLEGHENEVKWVDWDRTGTRLVSCGRDKTVWIWDADAPGNEFSCLEVLLGHTQDVKKSYFHTFARQVLSCSYDNTIRVWNEVMEQEHSEDIGLSSERWRSAGILEHHNSTVWDIAFSTDGQRMASVDGEGCLAIWRKIHDKTPEEWKVESSWCSVLPKDSVKADSDTKMFKDDLYTVDWSVEDYIAVGTAGDDIRIYHHRKVDGEKAWNLLLVLSFKNAHYDDVHCLAWHPDDPKLLASVGGDGKLKFWRISK